MAGSDSMKMLLNDDVVYQNRRPTTAFNRTTHTQPKRRPMTSQCCSKGKATWLSILVRESIQKQSSHQFNNI